MRSRCVRIPMTLGNPWDWRMLRNSNVSWHCLSMGNQRKPNRPPTISKPKEPSIISKTRSAILPMSIMLLRSLLHSMKVRRRFLPVTTVTGPFMSLRVCLVYRLTRLLRRVVFPTPGGPTIATITGGGSSSGVRLTKGTCRRVWSRSALRRPCRSARKPDFGANAYQGLRFCYRRSVITAYLFVEAMLLFFPLPLVLFLGL